MSRDSSLELDDLLNDLNEINIEDDVYETPLDYASRNSSRVSVNNGKISYYEEPKERDSIKEHHHHEHKEEIKTPSSTKCDKCSKDIVGDALQALDRLYHIDCFCCRKCSKKIGNEEFYVHDNHPYCENCYKHSFLPKCSRCFKQIDGKYLKALDQDFHENCFNCATCHKLFHDGKFYEKNKNAYCNEDYHKMFGYSCAKCHQSITDGSTISALDKYWHKHHFTCTKCDKPFNDGKFFEDDGMPYCQEHFHQKKGTYCAKCNKVIEGQCLSALNQKFHPNCFTCTNCHCVLGGQILQSEGKPYCPKCAEKL